MHNYPIVAYVKKTITDTITIDVRARSQDEAYELAEKMLLTYPAPTDTGNNIPYCFVEQREYSNPVVLAIMERKEDDGA